MFDAKLKELKNGWEINDKNHLYKEFKFKNFKEAMDFANKITDLAEAANHHPDLYISWAKISVEIWTHDINDLSEKDFALAQNIEEIR